MRDPLKNFLLTVAGVVLLLGILVYSTCQSGTSEDVPNRPAVVDTVRVFKTITETLRYSPSTLPPHDHPQTCANFAIVASSYTCRDTLPDGTVRR